MLHSFSLFIYKRQLPQSHPHPQTQHCPKLEPDFWETGRWWMLFWVLKERLDQEGGDFMVWGFLGEKKIGSSCIFFC